MQAKVGCCGFAMVRAEYYRRFPVVEIQQTFYDLPRIQRAERWRREALIRRSRNGRAVFQCPPRFTPTPTHVENLRKFFRTADRAGFVAAWEPRGDWPPDLVRRLCAELDLVHVVDPLKQLPQSEELRYFRLHGVTGYRYLHTDQDLQAVAEQCAGEEPIYVLFNNLFMGEDALRLQKLLARPALRLVRTARQRRA